MFVTVNQAFNRIDGYAPEDGPAASIIERWAKAQAPRDVQVSWQREPGWDFVKQLV